MQELGGRELGVRGCGEGGRFVYEEVRTRGSWEEAADSGLTGKMTLRPDPAAVKHEQELATRAAFMQDIIFSTLMPL